MIGFALFEARTHLSATRATQACLRLIKIHAEYIRALFFNMVNTLFSIVFKYTVLLPTPL